MVEKTTQIEKEVKDIKINSFEEVSIKKQLSKILSNLNNFVKYSKNIEKEHLNKRLDDLNEFLLEIQNDESS